MTRPRKSSAASEESDGTVLAGDQELDSMYDYLAKIILLGPSGSGKSCLLHRFVKSEWRILSSQTIGVEFASKIIKVGTGARRKRIKLQLWDTAGTERFRSVSRSYYRGAAGAVLVYDITSHATFRGLAPFLNDARALASPNLSTILVGNKLDLTSDHPVDNDHHHHHQHNHHNHTTNNNNINININTYNNTHTHLPPPSATPSSVGSSWMGGGTPGSVGTGSGMGTLGRGFKATEAPEGREVSAAEASRWASTVNVPVVMEASALSGEGVDEIFGRLARMILTKIELGGIDPDDPMSGIQYGDGGGGYGGYGGWNAGASDGASIKSSVTSATLDETGLRRRGVGGGGGRGRTRGGRPGNSNWGGLREWEEVFTLSSRRRGGNCC
ncbi:ras-domain-containing protein [Sodiomyces alkalinus F11]|uniref:Ras-domain-containing protein n=1 Tax=Sodiomyces alkalinus (strain CBS 110278 / VKM F-3762 / F11) TaxID=1314773 RepID=A0A3N2PYY6_SODAK|nr:ras-domain-containing protein [Sodiomyces alkalinus F11]ROT39638.1 ras-domain-containing protein [Sodiomyces alkalinus F11]